MQVIKSIFMELFKVMGFKIFDVKLKWEKTCQNYFDLYFKVVVNIKYEKGEISSFYFS